MDMTLEEACRILSVSRFADLDTIKRAFRRGAMRHHPDRGGSDEEMQRLNEALELLKGNFGAEPFMALWQAGGSFTFAAARFVARILGDPWPSLVETNLLILGAFWGIRMRS